MRRFVVPLMVGMIVFLSAGPAFGQTTESKYDSLGFGRKMIDTLRCAPGDSINLPVFLSTDSMVVGLSMLFQFNPDILYPQIAFDQNYQNLINAGGYVPDSTDYKASPVMDSGLWNLQIYLPANVRTTWNKDWGSYFALYNLNDRGHARMLFTPIAPPDTNWPGYQMPYIPGKLGADGGGGIIAYLPFWIKDDQSLLGTYTQITLETENDDWQKTELAEQWIDGFGLKITQAVLPTRVRTIFVCVEDTTCDTCTEPPPVGTNHLPVLVLGTGQTAFEINPGQQVSFAVSATDAEGGEVRIKCNNGNLPPNSSFGIGGQVVGGGGVVSGTFSFVPDISQQGSYVFSFIATDDSAASSAAKSVSVVVAKPDVDILFTTSAQGLSPTGGVPGLTEVMVPINVVTNNIIYGIQFDMEYDANNFDLDSVITSDRVPDWVVYDNIGLDPGFLRVVAFGLANDSMVPGTTSAALYLAFSVDEFAKVGAYPLDIYNAWESIDPDPNVPSLEFETDSGVIYVDSWGDVNLDLRIDVADLVSTVAYIIGTYDLSRRQFATADIVIDGLVNVVDLVGIINTIFGLPISPSPVQDIDGESAYLKVAHEEIPGAGIESEMQVLADMPVSVAGVELDIQYNPQAVEMLRPRLAEASDGFLLRFTDNGAGHMKVLIYSDHPWNEQELIPQGLADIVKLPFVSRSSIEADDTRQVRITKAFISTGAAKNVPVEGLGGPALPNTFELYQNRPNPFNPLTTIDFYIEGDDFSGAEKVTLEVFNILGQKVKTLIDEALASGQYSAVWDGTDEYGEQSASGIYLYRLRVGDANQTKKMMLLK